MNAKGVGNPDRWISLGPGTFRIPERLLLEHARGRVLFITGAGSSMPAGLPDFRGLVRLVYERIEKSMLGDIDAIIGAAHGNWTPSSKFIAEQNAELRRFDGRDYDIVLGMLERRMDPRSGAGSIVRRAVIESLEDLSGEPSDLHRSLARLANRGEATTILTTNYDLLLEKAAARFKPKIASLSLGAIPRPGPGADFAGIMHIHGALSPKGGQACEMVLTDQDFGEYYLRRRIIPDLIYDAARLFNLVLVGYSASDAPMRYLLNAVAADNVRFDDLQERFVFVAGKDIPDPVEIADWKQRGMTPIPYDAAQDHAALAGGLRRWARLSAINGSVAAVDAAVRAVVRRPRDGVDEHERDLVDHLFRRGNTAERSRLTKIANTVKAEPAWLEAFAAIVREKAVA